MITLLFVLISLTFFLASYRLMSRRQLTAKSRDELFIKRKKNRSIGFMLLFPALLMLVLALVNFFAVPVLPTSFSELIARDEVRAVHAPPTNGTVDTTPSLPSEAPPKPIGPLTQADADDGVDPELKKLNALVEANPGSAEAYGARGNLYAVRQSWDRAESDYRSALRINDKLTKVAFNLAEIELHLKKYDAARAGFMPLQTDADVGELSSYKIFLCDLFGGHDDTANQELATFNQAGTGPSYYFANVASSLYHGKPKDAGDWLKSATNIYDPAKIDMYTATLKDLGYMSFVPNKPAQQ